MARNSASVDRPKGRDFRYLRRTAGFLKPYTGHVLAAVSALVITGLSVLGLGQGLKALIDGGLARSDSSALDSALFLLLALSLIMAGRAGSG